MELYIGGCGQDKLSVVLDSQKELSKSESGRTAAGERPEIFHGEEILSSRVFQCRVINHFHLILRKMPESDIPLFLEELYEKNPDVIIICDEVGNGIVPVEKEERLYREQVGRSCQWLAAKSRRVVRIVCGCKQVIKEQTDREKK
ncbi:MAG: bifunctional adenosylcobinamide kinase/adenosylcobinamide-phosphate guanylyltransferase [Lachnospiraceae bacterium]|nr:bifunctional adenosylcobinamide kinase/adenosylcobinamide-phosphate guanylyltransferase [Lachnospiraceae bacterium]